MLPRMNIRNVLVVAAVLLVASTASARRTGNTYSLATGCTSCHGGGGAVAPTILITQVTADPLTEGGSAIFNVSLTSNTAAGVGRFASFAASIATDAGQFVDGAETELCVVGGSASTTCPANRTAIRDVTRRDFVDGSYDWDIELSDLGAGTFTLAVGGNDVNGNGGSGSGDDNANATLEFTVTGGAGGEGEGEGDPPVGEGEGEAPVGEGEGEPAAEGEGEPAAEGEGEPVAEGEGEDGGDVGGGGCCSLTGTSPASSVGLVVVLAMLRRRRQR